MKQIPLNKGLFALVDDEDFAELSAWTWYVKVSRNTLYAVRRDPSGPGKFVRMHRQILKTSSKVDHKNGNGLDNQKENLRPATSSQNAANRRNKPARGATFCRATGKWKAQIMVNGINKHLGRFATEAEARAAYANAAPQHFGEFACVGASL